MGGDVQTLYDVLVDVVCDSKKEREAENGFDLILSEPTNLQKYIFHRSELSYGKTSCIHSKCAFIYLIIQSFIHLKLGKAAWEKPARVS